MGLYIRKSVRVGPFRFNLSKSGVGVSAGVKGFRVGVSPKVLIRETLYNAVIDNRGPLSRDEMEIAGDNVLYVITTIHAILVTEELEKEGLVRKGIVDMPDARRELI